MFRFSRLSVASLHCELIWAIRLSAATGTFVCPCSDMVAPYCSEIVYPLKCTVTVRNYEVRKKQELRGIAPMVVNAKQPDKKKTLFL
jgi:hypothetical protein